MKFIQGDFCLKQYLRIFIILSTVVLLSCNLILAVHGTDTKTSQTVGNSSITSIEEQVRAFAKSINQTKADDTAAWALAKYGIVGGGKTLNIGKTHSLTATLWNSELALKTIIQSCKVSIDVMQQQNLSAVFGDAGCRWENSRNIYYEPALYKKMVNVKKGEGLCYPSNYVDFKGSLNSSIVHPREIFKEAVQRGSANIIICHNHPSGDPTPSKEDIDVTLRIKQCGDLMGIKLLDHIIIGNSNYISLKEKGII